MTSANFFITLGWIPSACMALGMFSLLKYSLAWSFSTNSISYLLHIISQIFGTWDSWRPVLLVRTEAKKAFSTSAFSLSSVTTTLILFSGLMFSLVFFLSLVYLQKPFLLPLTSVARFNSIWASVFLTSSLYSSTCVCLTGYLSLFPPSVYIFLVFSFCFADSYRSPDICACLSLCWNNFLLSLEEILGY